MEAIINQLTNNKILNSEFKSCILFLEENGYRFSVPISLEISVRSRALGKCCYTKNSHRVIINMGIVEQGGDILKQTILHELIHCLTPGSHHGYGWKVIANRVSALTGLNITRLTSTEPLGEDYKMKFKHVYRCTECGKLFGYARLPNWHNRTQYVRCRCSNKYGTLEKIK